jgi:hypothetical protein
MHMLPVVIVAAAQPVMLTLRSCAVWFAVSAALLAASAGCSARGSTLPPAAALSSDANEVAAATYPAAMLETWYETSFCQLSTAGTSWQSTQCQQDVSLIAAQAVTGHFNLNDKPIAKNRLGVTGATFQAIAYTTTVRLPAGVRTFKVSGALAMPLGINKTKLKGVVVCFHGTQLDNSSVPSKLSAEIKLEIALFTSQGYVVVSPDYIGQGVDYADVHPYVLYPQVTAQTAVDLLSAVLPQITSRYALSRAERLKLFSTGYSEGGAYSLWFYTYAHAHPSVLKPAFALTHAVGNEGAYNLSRVTTGFLFSDVNLADNAYHIQSQAITNVAKPVLGADVLLSFATYSLNSKYAAVFNPGFFALTCSFPNNKSKCEIGGRQLNVAQALTLPATDPSLAVLNSAENKKTGRYAYPGPLQILTSKTNNATALLASVNVPASPALRAALMAADVDLSAVGTNAVSIVTLKDDSVVTPNNFDALISSYPSKLATKVRLDQTNLLVAAVNPLTHATKYHPPDHNNAMVYELPYDLGILNKF